MNISLSPEILFYLGGLPVTNTLLWSFIIGLFLMIFFVSIARKMKSVPSPAQNLVETLMEGAYDFIRTVTGNDKKAKRVFPLIFTIFIFTLVANLIVYIPGQSAVTLGSGENAVPVFRAVMSDYGMVFMITIISILTIQIVAIIVHGPFGYLGKFLNLSGIKLFFSELLKGKVKFGVLAQGFLDLFLSLMEFVGEVAKIVSLSFRLFGNIFAGEVLTAVVLFLLPFFGPLPFMFLGLLTSVVQAFVFAVLTLIYITMASEIEGEVDTSDKLPAQSCDA